MGIIIAVEEQEQSLLAHKTRKTARKRQKMSPPDMEQPTVPRPAPTQNSPQAQPKAQDKMQAQGIRNQGMVAPPSEPHCYNVESQSQPGYYPQQQEQELQQQDCNVLFPSGFFFPE
jgi:hypothetical protein